MGVCIEMNFLNIYRGLPKTIYVLFMAQVINRFGDFVVPFLTLYLVKKLGFSFQSAGMAVMTASLLTIPGSYVGGRISDQFGRKKTYLVLQSISAICLFLCAFTKVPMLIVGLIVSASFFNGGVRPVMSAMMTDVLTPEKRQAGFSLSYLGINIGVGLGSMVAGYLFRNHTQMIFIGSAFFTAMAILLMATQIEETHPERTGEPVHAGKNEQAESGHIFQALARRPQILAFLLINIFFSVCYTQHSFSLPLMLEKIFGDSGPTNFGYIMSCNAATVLLMTVFVIRYTKEWHPLTSIMVAGITYFVGFGMIGYIHTFPMFLLSTFIWTLGEIMMVTSFGVYIANNSPQNFRARFNAVSSITFAVGSALGTSAMGRYMDAMGVAKVWPLVMILALIGILGIFVLRLYSLRQSDTSVSQADEA